MLIFSITTYYVIISKPPCQIVVLFHNHDWKNIGNYSLSNAFSEKLPKAISILFRWK
jgi:hypothetical protein